MKFILSGGGLGEKTKEAYSLFAQELKGEKVLFVPIADNEISCEDSLSWFKQEVASYGITNIDLITSPSEITVEKLSKAKGIYFKGGNAFLLLSLLKNSNAFANIQKFLQSDKIVMGGSAGAVIFGNNITPSLKDEFNIIATDENSVGLKDFEGFDVASGYSFFPHYRVKERQYEVTEQKLQSLLNLGEKMICLPEETCVVIENGKIEIVGSLPADVATAEFRKKIYPGQHI